MIRKYVTRKSIAAALIVCIAFAGYLAARQGASDYYAHTVYLEIESWSQPGHKFRGDELPRAVGHIENSLDWMPRSAWALEQMGSLQLGVVQSATDPAMAVAAARASYRHFKLALAQRPTSPFAWANLARAKLFLGEADDEMFNALARTLDMGPWEMQPLLTALLVGLATWGKADAAQREMILSIRDRAVMRDADKVAEVAKGFNRLDLICDRKTGTSPSGRPCPRPRS
jgi:hypothetical protein